MKRVGIVDYGLGNKRSVAGAIDYLGHDPVCSADAGQLSACDCLILPGVGAFADGMARLADRGLVDCLEELVLGLGKPILGICLGAQLLSKSSTEHGDHAGLGWVPARVERLDPDGEGLRVPHVGWNELVPVAPSGLFQGLTPGDLFYYVHGYVIQAEDGLGVTGICDHGGSFVASFEVGNIFGTQFHPEKSQKPGLTVLDNFLKLA